MPLDGSSAARADIVYPRLNVTVDTGAGVDVRNLDDINGATNDATTTATALATNDNVERTFDPATGGVTNTNHAGTTLFRLGWAFPVADMAPVDDTACNAIITAQTLNVLVNMSLTWSSSVADPATGTVAITFRASLWRYNPSTDAGVLIAAGSVATPTWNIAVAGGDPKGTFKQATIPIVIPAGGIEFASGEVLFLQIGFNTGTLPNPLSGTTTYVFALQVDSASTLIDFAAGQGIRLVCVKSDTCVGEGLVVAPLKQVTLARTTIGEGLITFTKASTISKTFTLLGEGVVSRVLAVAEDFNLIGEGVSSMTRVVGASKTFTLIGEGLVPRAGLAITLARTARGEGLVSFTKASTVSKTFTLLGVGIVTEVHPVSAFRTFTLIGEGIIVTTGANTSTICIPIDEVPEGGGGGGDIIIINKIFSPMRMKR